MTTWKRRLVFCLRHGVPLSLLLVLAWLLYVILGPPPRWSVTGQLRLAEVTRNGKWIQLGVGEDWLNNFAPPDQAFQVASVESGQIVFSIPTDYFWRRATSSDDSYVVINSKPKIAHFFYFDSHREFEAAIPEHDGYKSTSFHASPSLCVVDHRLGGYPAKYIPKDWEGCATVLDASTGQMILSSDQPRCYFGTTPDEELIFNCEGRKDEALLELWQMKPLPQVRRFPGLTAHELSKDGRTLLVVNRLSEYVGLDIKSGELRPFLQTVDGKTSPIVYQENRGAWLWEGPVVWSSHWRANLSFWDNSPWERAKAIRNRLPNADIDVSPCGNWALTGERSGGKKSLVQLWNTDSAEPLFSEEGTEEQRSHRFTDMHLLLFDGEFSGRWLSNQAAQSAKIIELETGAEVDRGKVFDRAPRYLAKEKTWPIWIGSILAKLGVPASTSWNVSNFESGREVLAYSTPHELIDLAVTEDERSVVTVEKVAGAEHILRVWDIPAQRPWGWIVGPPLTLAMLLYAFRWWRRTHGVVSSFNRAR